MQQMMMNPQMMPDPAKFEQALQNNPYPMHCSPKPLLGLPALAASVAQQNKAMEECTAHLDQLKSRFGDLKNALQVNMLQKLDECRRRHQKLSRQLLEVVAATESFAAANGAACRNPNAEAQLEFRLARLEEAVHAPASARARIEELWAVLHGLAQRGPPSGGAERLGDAEADKILRITDSQGELLEMLQQELACKKAEVTQFETALSSLSTSAKLSSAQTM